MSPNTRLIKESFALVEPVAGRAAAYFYGLLFAHCPSLRGMFPPDMAAPRGRLFDVLRRIVRELDSPERLTPYLARLGRDQRRHGFSPSTTRPPAPPCSPP